jgi:hypothetical protein
MLSNDTGKEIECLCIEESNMIVQCTASGCLLLLLFHKMVIKKDAERKKAETSALFFPLV